MKASFASLVLGASIASAASIRRDTPKLGPDTVPGFKVLPPPLYSGLFDKNGKLQAVLSNGNYTVPKSLVAEVQEETPITFKDAKRVKIRYGPYRLPGTKEQNWQVKAMGLSGMADVYVPNLKKPCDTCLLASINADMEYANGTKTGSSAWLHHSVLVTAGPKIRDPICNASNTESIFSSGNERATTTYSDRKNTVKVGYRMRPEDTITLVGEFKNELPTEQWFWLTIGYEYYDGARPDWKDSHVAWLGLGKSSCDPKAPNPFGPSNITEKSMPKSKVFQESTIPWKTPFDFEILAAGGHLHDGGETIHIYQNDKVICDAKANYATGVSSGMSHGHADGEHIKSIDSCRLFTKAKTGDTFHLTAYYNMEKHQGSVMDDGSLDEVMGVGTILMITDPTM